MALEIRELEQADLPFLWEMLYEAKHEPGGGNGRMLLTFS